MSRSPLWSAFLMTSAAVVSATADAARPVEEIQAELDAHNYMPREILVQYRAGADQWMRGEARSQVAAERLETVLAASKRQDGKGDLELVRVPPGPGLAAAIARLENDPAVEFAEANWIYFHQADSNDPYVTTSTASSQLWGMYSATATGGGKANAFGSGATTAWAANKTDCSSVYVGIIDEGYMYTHEDLEANAGVNPGEIDGNGRDDDGNGYIDDVYGWDFDGKNKTVFDGTGDDHGTHVAGTIGGVGGNGKGVAGVCWSVKLLSAKFLGSRGGTTANAIKAVDYFTDLKTRHGLNLVATNNSWGGGGFSQGLKDAIDRAGAANILFVAAAGNSGTNNDVTPSYPSGYDNPNIIAVASITSTGALSSFSQYGATTVDIGAPGSGIWSTVPKSSKRVIVSGYASYSGTSMATPHVTGAAALYKALNPAATAAQVKAAILTATPTSSLSGKVVTGGRLNVSGF